MKRKIGFFFVSLIMLTSLLLIWPGNIIKKEAVSHNGGDALHITEPLLDGVIAKQIFYPQYSYIRSISIDINRSEWAAAEGTLHFELYDAKEKCIYQWERAVNEVADSCFCEISVRKHVKASEEYSWQLYMTDCGETAPKLICTPEGVTSPIENGLLFVGGEVTECNAIVMYKYGTFVGKTAVLTYWAWILCVGILVLTFFEKKD